MPLWDGFPCMTAILLPLALMVMSFFLQRARTVPLNKQASHLDRCKVSMGAFNVTKLTSIASQHASAIATGKQGTPASLVTGLISLIAYCILIGWQGHTCRPSKKVILFWHTSICLYSTLKFSPSRLLPGSTSLLPHCSPEIEAYVWCQR